MAIDPPYRLDPFQNIIGLQWTEPPITDHPYLWGSTGYGAAAGQAGGVGEARNVLAFFATPGYGNSLTIGHCQINYVSEVYPFPGKVLYQADGDWTGLPPYEQFTSSPPPDYVVIFTSFTDDGNGTNNANYIFKNTKPPGDEIAGGTVAVNFSGVSITLNGYVNRIIGTESPGIDFVPFLQGKVLSYDSEYQGVLRLAPDLFPPMGM